MPRGRLVGSRLSQTSKKRIAAGVRHAHIKRRERAEQQDLAVKVLHTDMYNLNQSEGADCNLEFTFSEIVSSSQ
eukprot:4530791-Amphidinium_carterae.1